MSKSRGTGHRPAALFEIGLNPEWVSLLRPPPNSTRVEDIDFNPDDFMARVNSDLVGKLVNIARSIGHFHTSILSRQIV